jgi:serine/threonine protein kinase
VFDHFEDNMYYISVQERTPFASPLDFSDFNEEMAEKTILSLLDTLVYLSSQNIIHMHIRPENILITKGIVKLRNFYLYEESIRTYRVAIPGHPLIPPIAAIPFAPEVMGM